MRAIAHALRGSLVALAATCLLAPATGAQEHYWERRAEGWFWYADPPAEAQPDREGQGREIPRPNPLVPPEIAAHERMQTELRELRVVAIMNPTPANVARYLRLQKRALDLSSTFADAWRRVVWSTPDLDHERSGRPANGLGAAIWDERRRRERGERLARLAEIRGIALFFKADCPLCVEMGRALARLRAKHGIHVMAISADGSGMDFLDDVRRDNGIFGRLGISTLPEVRLLDPRSMDAIPVGGGIMSLEEIEERIDAITHLTLGMKF